MSSGRAWLAAGVLAAAAAAAAAVAAAGVLATRSAPRLVADLATALPQARTQPSASAFRLAEVDAASGRDRAILAASNSRLTFHVTVPHGARFQVGLDRAPGEPASPLQFLIGVSDGHAYQLLRTFDLPATAGSSGERREVDLSLEEYAGLTIDLVLNTRSGSPDPERGALPAAWVEPVVVAR